MDKAQADILTHLSVPKAHRLQIRSTNPLERLNAEIKRRTDVVGIAAPGLFSTTTGCPSPRRGAVPRSGR